MASIVLPEGIQLLSGVEANRTSVIPDVAEPLVTTDQRRLFVGDNATAGGNEIAYRRTGFVDEVAVQGATPATPAAGKVTNGYVGSDGSYNYVNDAGEVVRIGPAETPVTKGALAPASFLRVVGAAGVVTVTANFVAASTSLGRTQTLATINNNITMPTVDGEYNIYVTADMDGVGRELWARRLGDAYAPPRPYVALVARALVSGGVLTAFRQRGSVVAIPRAVVLGSGTQTAYTALSLAQFIPTTASAAFFSLAVFGPTNMAAAGSMQISSDGTDDYRTLSGLRATTNGTGPLVTQGEWFPLDTTTIYYKIGGAATSGQIFISGYLHEV